LPADTVLYLKPVEIQDTLSSTEEDQAYLLRHK